MVLGRAGFLAVRSSLTSTCHPRCQQSSSSSTFTIFDTSCRSIHTTYTMASPPSTSSSISVAGSNEDEDASPPSSPPLLPKPFLDARWVHAGSQHLTLPSAPIKSLATAYKAFSRIESDRIEDRWFDLSEEERNKAIEEWGQEDGVGAPTPSGKKKDRNKDKSNRKDEKKEDKVNMRVGEVDDIELGDSSVKEEILSGQEQAEEESGLYKALIRQLEKDADPDNPDGVPVSQDSLFEVHLPTLSLHPAFWAHTGPRVPVLRGTWFGGDETSPVNWKLADQLEQAYQEIKPWLPSYKDELATAIKIGKGSEEKMRYHLPPEFGEGLSIIFEDSKTAKMIHSGSLPYISRDIWSTFKANTSGIYMYRGYARACEASGNASSKDDQKSASSSRRGSTSSIGSAEGKERKDNKAIPLRKKALSKDFKSDMSGLNEDIKKAGQSVGQAVNDAVQAAKDATTAPKDFDQAQEDVAKSTNADSQTAREEEVVPVVSESEDDAPCTDLILVIHGIGQQLASHYEALSFVYAGNQIRQGLRTQAANPAISSILRDRRCQVLPVQWRASLELDQQPTEEEQAHGMDNRFTMADITINTSITMVREVVNAVLLDIPLYMSNHRQKMIEGVCIQANRLYRLWLARNPDFEKNGGRVHIVGHSLGSALAADILSNQPTRMPPLADLPKQVVSTTKDRFIFNTSSLFLCGSPLGLFLHLQQSQIMPRKGRERTMNSPPDEALDRTGKFGCMAIDNLYNVFYHTDAIAYQLNATVDCKLAKERPAMAITAVTAPMYAAITEGMSTISRYFPSLPYMSSGSGTPLQNKTDRPGPKRLPSGLEMTGPSGEEQLKGTRGERRFSALNPHGNIDFYLPSAGVSEYIDMITAHQSYWTDASFAAFLLTEIFSTRLDQIRTGMGLTPDSAER